MTKNVELIVSPPSIPNLVERKSAFPVPKIVSDASPAANFAWDEFFLGSLRNPHTRAAYGRAVHAFLGWLEPSRVPLTQVTPGLVGSYFDQLDLSVPSKKLALAAIRRFFDAMVQRHVMS